MQQRHPAEGLYSSPSERPPHRPGRRYDPWTKPQGSAPRYGSQNPNFLPNIQNYSQFPDNTYGEMEERRYNEGLRAMPGSIDDPTMEAFISRTLYMNNIPASITEEQLQALCLQHGGDTRRITLQSEKGIAFVEFHDIRAAEKARNSLKGYTHEGMERPITVQYSKSREERPPRDGVLVKATLYVRPSTGIREFVDPNSLEEYKELFGKFGEVKAVTPNKKREAEKFIEFYDLRVAEAALKGLNGQEFNGIKLEIQYANISSKTPNPESKLHDMLVSGRGGPSHEKGYNPIRFHPGGRNAGHRPPMHPYDVMQMPPMTPCVPPPIDPIQCQQYAALLQQQMQTVQMMQNITSLPSRPYSRNSPYARPRGRPPRQEQHYGEEHAGVDHGAPPMPSPHSGI